MRLEGFYINENPLKPAGIETATFRFVAQHIMIISLSVLRVRTVSDKNLEKSKDKICVRKRVPENRAVCEIMWKKYGRAGQATTDNMAYAHCMLDN